MKKILLVEDDANVVSFIMKGLTEENFNVSVAFDGTTGIDMASLNAFDLIILDIMLPGTNGLDVCKALRSKGINAPILFLTALNTSENIALGLNSGADDYLAKPFKFIELVARINALLRRSGNAQHDSSDAPHVFQFSNLTVDDLAKKVVRSGEEINLTATEYRLLLLLLKNKGRVLSRAELLEGAWDIHYNLSTNVVDVYINYLRKKMDTHFEPKLIHTIIGMGYVMKEA